MQSQAYPSQGGDFMKMTSGEQDSVDVHQHGAEGGEQKKKSVVGKVKDKAKKLKSKIKGSGKKKTDEHGNEVDHSSSSEGEEESPQHQPQVTSTARGFGSETKEQQPHVPSTDRGFGGTEEVRDDGVVHGGEEYKSSDFPPKVSGGDEYKSRDSPPKEDLTSGLGDQLGKMRVSEDSSAPATGAAWYNEPPSVDETHKRQEQVPSDLGQESAGISSGIASSGLGSDKKEHSSGGFSGFDTENKERDFSPSSAAAGGLLGSSDEKSLESIMKPDPVTDGVDNSGRDLLSAKVTDAEETPRLETPGGELSEGLTGGESETLNKELKPSGSQKGWMQRATEGVTSVKNALLGSPKASTTDVSSLPEDNKTWTEKARDAVVSTKDTVASKLPSSTSPSDVPVSEQASETGHAAADKSSGITTRAMETATGLKDTAASKLGYGGPTSGTTGSETTSLGTTEADSTKSGPGMTQKVLEMKDAVVSKLGYGTGGNTGGTTDVSSGKVDDQSGGKLFTPDEHDTALSQKITDMLTLGGKNTNETQISDTTTPHDASQGKGVYDRVTGAVGSLLGKKSDEKPVTDTTTDTHSGAVVSEH